MNWEFHIEWPKDHFGHLPIFSVLSNTLPTQSNNPYNLLLRRLITVQSMVNAWRSSFTIYHIASSVNSSINFFFLSFFLSSFSLHDSYIPFFLISLSIHLCINKSSIILHSIIRIFSFLDAFLIIDLLLKIILELCNSTSE